MDKELGVLSVLTGLLVIGSIIGLALATIVVYHV